MTLFSRFTKLRGVNYKAFEGPFELDLAPLTIVFGRNGSGKTALLRLPLLLCDALAGTTSTPGLPLKARGLVMGNSLASFVHGGAADRYEIGLEFEHDGRPRMLDITVGHDRSTPLRLPGQWIDRWQLSDETGEIASFVWDSRSKSYTSQSHTDLAASFRGLLPIYADTTPHSIVRSLGTPPRVIHMAAARGIPGEDFVPEQPNVSLDVESDGAATRRVLGALRFHPREEILGAVVEGVRECFGVTMRVEEVAQSSIQGTIIKAKSNDRDTWLPITEFGTGLAHALPLITQYAIAAHRPDDESPYVLLCEEPEAHAHPLVQAKIADIIIKLVRAGGCTSVLETHSETFVLRVRRRVAEGRLSPEDVAFYWVDDEGPTTEVYRLGIDERGHIEGWPEGWFDTAVREVRAIHRAMGSP